MTAASGSVYCSQPGNCRNCATVSGWVAGVKREGGEEGEEELGKVTTAPSRLVLSGEAFLPAARHQKGPAYPVPKKEGEN